MTDRLQPSLETLFAELVHGPAADAAWMLNPGDDGLLRALDRLPASSASVVQPAGGASIAAHVEHLRYGLSLMNRWGRGDPNPWTTADWAAGWKRTHVTDPEWSTLREALAPEARDWLNVPRTPRKYSSSELNGVIASIAHLA